MAHFTDAIPITFRGKLADLCVIRNDGYCWGRITTAAGEQFDVSPIEDEDLYDSDDVDARQRFEELARDEANISPAQAWL
jgi:hypothetical protein